MSDSIQVTKTQNPEGHKIRPHAGHHNTRSSRSQRQTPPRSPQHKILKVRHHSGHHHTRLKVTRLNSTQVNTRSQCQTPLKSPQQKTLKVTRTDSIQVTKTQNPKGHKVRPPLSSPSPQHNPFRSSDYMILKVRSPLRSPQHKILKVTRSNPIQVTKT